jgi:hypothetical protein
VGFVTRGPELTPSKEAGENNLQEAVPTAVER